MASQAKTDTKLKTAALRDDVEFLQKCVASNKSIDYYLTLFESNPPENYHKRNIFHLAATRNSESFIREIIKILPFDAIEQLLLQTREEDLYNPLHIAATVGNLEIVRLFLNVYRTLLPSSPSSSRRKPWLEKNGKGLTPLRSALYNNHEDCGLEILKMDVEEVVCDTNNTDGSSLLYEAVTRGFSKFALEVLSSVPSFSCRGSNGFTPLHKVASCSEGEDVCKLLLERKPELIKQKSKEGFSVLHSWAASGKLWPFQCLLKGNNNNDKLDVGKVFVDLMSQSSKNGSNPLHILASNTSFSNEDDVVEIAKLLIETYKQEVATQASSSISGDLCPWLLQDKKGDTPLSLAMKCGCEKLAMYLISIDNNNALRKYEQNPLFLAIENGCHEVAEEILNIVNQQGWTRLLTNDRLLNVLHLAPKFEKEMFERLLKQYPELLEGVDKDGNTVVHSWVRIGKLEPFEYIIQKGEIDRKWRSHFVKSISATDYVNGNNPFHVAAAAAALSNQEATEQVVKLLVEAFKEKSPNWRSSLPAWLPWFKRNRAGDGPLYEAIRNKQENLALYILSLHQADHIDQLLDYYKDKKIVFLAIEKKCFRVAKELITRLDRRSWDKFLKDESELSSTGRSVLHLAPSCTDKEFGRWLVEKAPELITQQDRSRKTPLDEASDVGATWILPTMLESSPSAFSSAPLAWIKACEKGHMSAVRVFVDYCPGKFSDHCIQHQDSPLHHIQLRNITGYEEFLKIPGMKDLINVQDSQGATPLHQAIRSRNILLTETLLNMDKIRYNIKDQENLTARDLLEVVCKEQNSWEQMCKSIGLDPRIKTTYFQHKTNLLDVRNTLSVVAALLATLTFTAGVTLPGGFNQNTGKAMLATEAAFLVFLISDTLAMCCSMLVLICLIWSMVVSHDSSKSLFLIDRSMMLLMVALFSTLLAFMTGVFIVISPQSLWAAIVIIIMCSLTIILAKRNLLYKCLVHLIPSTTMEDVDPLRLMEMGKACLCQGGNSCLKCN